ncbi:hypothetical protein SAMN05421847_2150 [Halpernia humi]|uniref:Uncharacterized protein n=1 Tax=Halpernia humi TaxID=493375 RepID=A0A1H5ZRM2_9FLAO|nr:hypothetical protein [Halpernia humi]SEG38654.1 hypothetical protein SAMN05421847_2150 [Halpernia humi]
MQEKEVITLLQELLEVSKNFEYKTRNAFQKLDSVPKSELKKMKDNNPKISQILDEFELVYSRIQKEI